MKTLFLAAFAVLGLAVAAANAAPLPTPAAPQAAPQQAGSQADWTIGGAGWG
jgi:hypothetical protein